MKRRVFAYPYIVWMVLFIVVPMLFIFFYAVNVRGEWTLTKAWATLTDAGKWNVLWISIVMAFKTTALCLLLGYPIAYILSKMKPSVAGFISVLFFVPMWMNFVLRTYAWQAILEYFLPNVMESGARVLVRILPQEFVTRFWPELIGYRCASLTGTEGAVLMVLVYNFLPFMVMPLYNTLAKLDKSLLEAARDLGANSFTTFFRVILPLSVPGIVSGITMVFIPAITAFTVPALIGNGKYNLYGNEIELAFKTLSGQGDFAVGSTLSLILLLCVLVSTVIMNYFDKDQKEGGQMW